MLDVRQAEQLVFTAAETIPDLERRIEQAEISSAHFWETTRPIARGAKLTEQPHAPEFQRASLDLLERTGHSPGRSTIDRGQR